MGARLRAIREVLDLTQDQVAEVAGVGLTTISGWESGRNKIDLVKLARIASYFSFTTDWVARGDLGGVRFDLAQRLQQRLRGEMAAQPARRGRPPGPSKGEDAPPLVRDAESDPPAPRRQTLHEPPSPLDPRKIHAPRKFFLTATRGVEYLRRRNRRRHPMADDPAHETQTLLGLTWSFADRLGVPPRNTDEPLPYAISSRQMACLSTATAAGCGRWGVVNADWLRGFRCGSDPSPGRDPLRADFAFLGLSGNVGGPASEIVNVNPDLSIPVSARQLRLLAYVCDHAAFRHRTWPIQDSLASFVAGYAAGSELLRAAGA